MSGDGWIDEVAAKPPQARKGPILVCAGEPAITDDIRNQDRRELSGLAHGAMDEAGESSVAVALGTSTPSSHTRF
jgi:hypothetical protein